MGVLMGCRQRLALHWRANAREVRPWRHGRATTCLSSLFRKLWSPDPKCRRITASYATHCHRSTTLERGAVSTGATRSAARSTPNEFRSRMTGGRFLHGRFLHAIGLRLTSMRGLTAMSCPPDQPSGCVSRTRHEARGFRSSNNAPPT